MIVATAARHKLPTVYVSRFTALDGGLISYGPDFRDQYWLAAGYVDRILKGRSWPTCRCRHGPNEMVINPRLPRRWASKFRRSLLAASTR